MKEEYIMYHRYTERSGGLQSSGGRMKEHIRTGVICVLLIAVILLSIFGGRAMSFQKDTHTTFVHRMQTECSNALTLTSSLSRTAGANTSATLGRIRSHLYAMDTINQISVGLEGGSYLVDNDVFTDLYALLDDYANKLITGMMTGDLQSALTNELTTLLAEVDALE